MKKVFSGSIIYVSMLLCGISCSLRASAQLNSSTSLPMLTAPSPKATMMDRFGNYPVSLYTGLVDITIPVFTVETNWISIPIEFKYHASGLRYDDVPMELGYGWTLMAGGTVSYSARGTSDVSPPSGFHQPPFIKWVSDIHPNDADEGNPDADQNWLGYVAEGSKPTQTTVPGYNFSDSEYDVYSYSFLNHTGQYYTLSGEQEVQVPKNALKILAGSSNVTIKDEKGITYSFDRMESDFYGRNNTYYLKRIVSADEADTIFFEYRYFGQGGGNGILRPIIDATYSVIETDPVLARGFRQTTYQYGGTYGITNKPFYPPVLTAIRYHGGSVDFTYQNETTSHSLKEINVHSATGTLIRKVNLIKPRTDWLDEVEFRDQANEKVYSYKLEYNGTVSGLGNGVDYWGYYNRSTLSGTAGYIPKFTIPVFSPGSSSGTYPYQIPGMDRTPDEQYMQRGILNKITYPTKGYSQLIYEPHRALGKMYGGLRIKEIRNYDENGTLTEKKWYRYGAGESGEGRAAFQIGNLTDLYFSNDFCSNSMLINSILGNGSDVPHPGDIVRTKQYYAFPKISYFTSGSSVVYPVVTEYTGTGTVSNGKTVYEYNDVPEQRLPTLHGYSSDISYLPDNATNGQLYKKTTYDANNQVVYELANNYRVTNIERYLNLRVLSYADIVGVEADKIKKNYSWYPYPGAFETFPGLMGGSLYDYFNYYINSGLLILASSVESVNGVTKISSYSAYNKYGQPGEVQVTDSKGGDVITKYKYPNDYATIEPYKTMVNKQMVAPVLEEAQYQNTTFLYKQFTEYKKWGGQLYAPEFMKQQHGQAAPETRLQYLAYDPQGNPISVKKDNGPSSSYLWDYNNQYPIAEAKNATQANIAYTSFEAGGKGNWTYNGTPVADGSSPTGSKAYNLAGNPVSKSGLTSSTKYILQYWAKSATATAISGGTATVVRSRQGWTQYQRAVTGVSSLQLSSSSALYVDDIRLYPQDAAMTTYTYDPLVGMTSETDPSGRVTYYRYDSFQRLLRTEDLEGNIIQAYDYHYKQP